MEARQSNWGKASAVEHLVRAWQQHRCPHCFRRLEVIKGYETCATHGEMTGDSYMRCVAQVLGIDKATEE